MENISWFYWIVGRVETFKILQISRTIKFTCSYLRMLSIIFAQCAHKWILCLHKIDCKRQWISQQDHLKCNRIFLFGSWWLANLFGCLWFSSMFLRVSDASRSSHSTSFYRANDMFAKWPNKSITTKEIHHNGNEIITIVINVFIISSTCYNVPLQNKIYFPSLFCSWMKTTTCPQRSPILNNTIKPMKNMA